MLDVVSLQFLTSRFSSFDRSCILLLLAFALSYVCPGNVEFGLVDRLASAVVRRRRVATSSSAAMGAAASSDAGKSEMQHATMVI
jgi:hypothetical protein